MFGIWSETATEVGNGRDDNDAETMPYVFAESYAGGFRALRNSQHRSD